MKKRNLVVKAVALVTVLSMLTGCGAATGGTPNKTPTSEQTGETKGPDSAEEKEKIEFEIIQRSGAPLEGELEKNGGEDFVRKEILEKLHVDLKVTGLPEYAQQLNIRLSSGVIPEVFLLPSRNSITEYIKNDFLLDLTPYQEELKNFDLSLGKVEDGIYVIPKKKTVANTAGIYIRKDWLNNLGLQEPKNMEELMTVAKAFTENDPDKNGKNDTYGITAWGINDFANILLANYKAPASNSLFIENNKLSASLFGEQMKEALSVAKSFVDAGVVDPEMIANTQQSLDDKVQQGKVGMLLGTWNTPWRKESMEIYKQVNPDTEWVLLEAFDGPYGSYTQIANYPASDYYAISADLANDPERVKRIIEVLDFVNTEEGNRLVCYGVEGKDYEVKDNQIVMTEDLERLKLSSFTWVYQMAGRDEQEYLKNKFAYNKENFEFAFSQPYLMNYAELVLPPTDFNLADMNTYIKEEMTKFIYGNRPIDEYDNFLNTLNTTYSYQEWLKEAESQLVAMGLLK